MLIPPPGLGRCSSRLGPCAKPPVDGGGLHSGFGMSWTDRHGGGGGGTLARRGGMEPAVSGLWGFPALETYICVAIIASRGATRRATNGDGFPPPLTPAEEETNKGTKNPGRN